ncbi:hypothetical protein CsSME_00047638 [Camellia sinensis var. sinensis]
MARHYNSSYYDYLQYFSLPVHMYFLLAVVFLILGFTWYINYESKFQDMMYQLKLIFILTPIVLLLVVHWLSSEDRHTVPFSISLPEKDSLHRAGGSAWGVAALLVFLLYMISYQSKLHESWFPLLSR